MGFSDKIIDSEFLSEALGAISHSCEIGFVVLVVLKVVGVEPVASWSWWWVTAPLWMCLPILCLPLLVIAAAVVVDLWREWMEAGRGQ